jgi:hypothetical protein
MDSKLATYSIEHNFSRGKFIMEIIGFSNACVSLGEKGISRFYTDNVNKRKVTLDTIGTLTDEQLIKIHKFFWDGL